MYSHLGGRQSGLRNHQALYVVASKGETEQGEVDQAYSWPAQSAVAVLCAPPSCCAASQRLIPDCWVPRREK